VISLKIGFCRGGKEKMQLYERRKIIQKLTDWLKLNPESRCEWESLCQEIGLLVGATQDQTLKVLNEISKGRLYIDKYGYLADREKPVHTQKTQSKNEEKSEELNNREENQDIGDPENDIAVTHLTENDNSQDENQEESG